jgi:hypothetical protein
VRDLFRDGVLRGTRTLLGSGHLGVYQSGRHLLGDRCKIDGP